jgi:hypothetical protein
MPHYNSQVLINIFFNVSKAGTESFLFPATDGSSQLKQYFSRTHRAQFLQWVEDYKTNVSFTQQFSFNGLSRTNIERKGTDP